MSGEEGDPPKKRQKVGEEAWTPRVENVTIRGHAVGQHVGDSISVGAGSTAVNVKNYYNLRSCPSESSKDAKQSHDNKYAIPELSPTFVSREEHEKTIKRWMAAKKTPALLRIWGPGSAGKTSIAISAAGRAKDLGFKKIMWINANHATMDEKQLKKCRDDVKKKIEGEEGPTLLIIDDVQDDSVVGKFECAPRVIITTRSNALGSPSSFKIEDLEIEGLTRTEIERLLERIMTTEKFEEMKKHGGLDKVEKPLSDFLNFPLLVEWVGRRLKDDYDEWEGSKKSVDRYIDEMTKELEEAKDNLKAKTKRVDAYINYDFNFVHAAVFDSIKRLEKKPKGEEATKKYRYLSVFKKKEVIRPASMAVIWGMEERAAKEQLRDFAAAGVLTDVGYNQAWTQREFVLHDLMFEVVEVWTRKDKMELTKDVIGRYVAASTDGEIEDGDVAFYTHFVTWCLVAGENNRAVEVVCRLQYLSNGMRLGSTIALFEDLQKLVNKGQEAVVPWRDFVGWCSRVVSLRGDAKSALDKLLRAALLWPHDKPPYKEAREMVKTDEFSTRTFLSRLISPRLTPSPYYPYPSAEDVDPENEIPLDSWIRLVEWMEEEEDFLVVYEHCRKENVVARLLKKKKDVVSVSGRVKSCSVGGGRLALGFDSRVEEFDLRSGRRLRSLDARGVTAVAHTRDGRGLWVVEEEGRRRSRIDDGSQRNTFEMPEDKVIVELRVLDDDVCLCKHGGYPFTLKAWRGSELLFSRRECQEFAVHPRTHRVVLFDKFGDVFLWRFDDGKETKLWSLPSEWKIEGKVECVQVLFGNDGEKVLIRFNLLVNYYFEETRCFLVDVKNSSVVTEVLKDWPFDCLDKVIAFSSPYVLMEILGMKIKTNSRIETWTGLCLADVKKKSVLLLIPNSIADEILISPNMDFAVVWTYDFGEIYRLEILQPGRPPFLHLFSK